MTNFLDATREKLHHWTGTTAPPPQEGLMDAPAPAPEHHNPIFHPVEDFHKALSALHPKETHAMPDPTPTAEAPAPPAPDVAAIRATLAQAEAAVASLPKVAASAPPQKSGLQKFEGFLKRVGRIGLVVIKDVDRYAIPVASVVALADPAVAPEMLAFTSSYRLARTTAIAVQAKWAGATPGPDTNANKLADALTIAEQPIITMFAQAGKQVDTAYVTNLINGAVAILNAEPAGNLPPAPTTPAAGA